MKGTIAAINVDNTFPQRVAGIAVGSPFEASFTIDKSVPDGFPDDPTVGSYLQTVPPFAVSVSLGGVTLSTSPRSFSQVAIQNHAPGVDPGDAVYISSGTLEMSSGWSIANQSSSSGSPFANFTFRDFSGRALSTKQLSTLPVIDLSMFPEIAFLNSFDVTLLGAGETLEFPGGSVSVTGSMIVFLSVAVLTATTLTNAGDDQAILLGESVTLRGSGTNLDGTTVSYSWDFGDGSPAETTATVTHTYTAAGAYVATLTVTDASGFTTADTAIVTVEGDETPPELTVPSLPIQIAQSAAGAPVAFEVSAMDLVSGSVTPVCTEASGSTFPIGITTVTCIATDGAGNVATGSFDVSVACCDISISVSPASAKRGQTMSIEGSIRNFSGVRQPVTLMFELQTPYTNRIGTLSLSLAAGVNKRFSMPFKIPANAPLGVYSVRLTTITTAGAIERIVEFTVIP